MFQHKNHYFIVRPRGAVNLIAIMPIKIDDRLFNEAIH